MGVETSGWRIYRWAMVRGWGHEELSRCSGVGILNLMLAEGDQWPLTPELLDKVAVALGVDVAELLPEEAAARMRDLIHRSGYHTDCGLECDVVRNRRTVEGLRVLDGMIAENPELFQNSWQI